LRGKLCSHQANDYVNQMPSTGEKPEYFFKGVVIGAENFAKEYISSMTPSLADANSEDMFLKKSYQLHIIGKCNYSQRKGNLESG
jgi:hypothetical protein